MMGIDISTRRLNLCCLLVIGGLLCIAAPSVLAADEYMATVTADPGKIMDGEKVLAEVPLGTRIWIFDVKPSWGEVKVPNSNQHGWILLSSVEKLKFTDAQRADFKKLAPLYGEQEKLDDAKNYRDARTKLEQIIALERRTWGNDHPYVAGSLNNLGILSAQLDEPAVARKYYDEALAIKRRILGDNPDTAKTLNNLGLLCDDQGDYAAAKKFYQESLDIHRRAYGDQHEATAEALYDVGSMLWHQGEYVAARRYLDEALAISRKIFGNNHNTTAQTLNMLGNLTKDQADFAASEKFHLEALAIRRRIAPADDPDTMASFNNLGNLADDQGEYDKAEKYFTEALAGFRKKYGNEHPSVASVLNNLGNAKNNQGDYAAARRNLEQALTIRRKVLPALHPELARSLDNVGAIAHQLGDFPTARKLYDEALAIRRQALPADHPETAGSLCSLGNLANDQGDTTAARKYYEEALASQRKTYGPEHPNVAKTLHNLGVVANAQKDYPNAHKYYQEAIAIKQKTLGQEHPDTVGTLLNMGTLARKQGDNATAQKLFLEGLQIRRKALGNDHTDTAVALENLGSLQRELGETRAAWNSFDEALRIERRAYGKEHPWTTGPMIALAELAVIDGEDDVAERNFDEVRRILRRYVRYLLPALSAPEQLRYLESSFREVWHTCLSYALRRPDSATIASLSTAWVLNGKAVGDEALAARELLARDTANPTLAPLVKELQEVRQRLGSQSLAAVKPEQAEAQQAALSELTAREYRLSQQLADATGQAFVEVDWIETGRFRRTLPDKTLYVDIVRMSISEFDPKIKEPPPPHYVAWIIPPQGAGKITILDLGPAEAIDAEVTRARASLAQTAAADGILKTEGEAKAAAVAAKNLQAIAQLVLQPLLPHLKDSQQLILAPDGALWLLPWAALPAGENKCLLEQCSIRYVLSGRDLLKKTGTSKLATTAPAIVVNPDYDLAGPAAKTAIQKRLPNFKFEESAVRGETSRSSLPRVAGLPFTSAEGAAAKPSLEHLSKSRPVFYEQNDALETVVKKIQRPKHLLLSTHGFFLSDQESKTRDDQQQLASNETRSVPALTTEGKPLENPLLRCGLLLAGCNAPRTPGLDDGILTGLEIVGMDLRGTELVVLSACETGVGKVRNGEGVAGLRQAFQLAGAQSVVSTLWQVPDRDSAIIMQDFFTNLAAGQSKADALRNAQLKRIAERKDKSGAAHPFFWAAWTVTGE